MTHSTDLAVLSRIAERRQGPFMGTTILWMNGEMGAFVDWWLSALFSKLKHFRRVASRYDKLAANFLAMVQLASLRLWLRAYRSMA